MKPVRFEEANRLLQPSGREYSENVLSVESLPVYTNDEECVSCWQMSWRERLAAFLFGHVWLCVLSGKTQPPVYIEATRSFLVKS